MRRRQPAAAERLPCCQGGWVLDFWRRVLDVDDPDAVARWRDGFAERCVHDRVEWARMLDADTGRPPYGLWTGRHLALVVAVRDLVPIEDSTHGFHAWLEWSESAEETEQRTVELGDRRLRRDTTGGPR